MDKKSAEKLELLRDSKSSGNDSNLIQEKTKRRNFSQAYKLKILERIEECKGKRGAIGELLRREGLYSAQVAKWKSDLTDGLAGIVKKRGPKPDPAAREKNKIAQLEKEKARLEKRLAEAEAVIEFQKKLSDLMGIKLPRRD